MTAPTITEVPSAARKSELIAMGYYVCDPGESSGLSFRWKSDENLDAQEHAVETEDEAWIALDLFVRNGHNNAP